jgi:uracil-DNA glycosylase
MEVKIHPSWKSILSDEFKKTYFTELVDFVRSEYQSQTVYPPGSQIFAAFDHCPFDKVRVVILGQDPYHGPGQAHGLCFSVNEGVPFPPSLLNIFKELQHDLGNSMPPNGSLKRWAEQGVLLLNATLTVRASQPGSHQNKGWETFTDAVVMKVSQLQEKVVFMLWGAYAQKKGEKIDASKHLVLKSPHPSPFSANRGFFGCRHFSRANDYLKKKDQSPIAW